MTFPAEGMALTHILVVDDLETTKTFYSDVLGAEVHREYGGTSCVLQFLGSWLLLVTGGGPTKDKPDVTFDCEECGQSVTFPGARRGGVETCPICNEYIDVPE